jgi:protein PhnA
VGEGGSIARSAIETGEGSVSAERTPHPTRTSSAPPSPTRGEGRSERLAIIPNGKHHIDIKVRDSNGAQIAEGDTVTLIKDLKLKGSSTVLKRGTVNIHLTDDPDEIEGRTDKVKGLVLRTEFLKKA